MAYTRINWQDLPSTATPRNATNLNKMDEGIKEHDDMLLGNKAIEKIVAGDIEGKNLFDINGNVNIQGNDGSQVNKNSVSGNILTTSVNSSSSHGVGQKFTGMLGKKITFSAKVVSVGSSASTTPQGGIAIYQNGGGTSVWGAVGDKISKTVVCSYDEIICTFSTHQGTGAQFTDIQVEINDEVTNYVPYKSFDNSESEVYSSNEIKIGKWIDGKPLYRKTITIGAFPNNSTKTVAHGSTNIDAIISIKGVGFLSDTARTTLALPNVDKDGLQYSIRVNVDKTNVYVTTGSDRTSMQGYVTIEYTKTTD